MNERERTVVYSPLIISLSLSLSQDEGLGLRREPPGCSSPSLSLLDAIAAALLLLLAPEWLRFGTRPATVVTRMAGFVFTVA